MLYIALNIATIIVLHLHYIVPDNVYDIVYDIVLNNTYDAACAGLRLCCCP